MAKIPAGSISPWVDDPPNPNKATYQRKWQGIFTMTAVGSYSMGVSIYVAHDLAGNAWEWVNDWYDREYYKTSPDKNPKGPVTGKFKTVRGGSWVNFPDALHSAFRRWSLPDARFNDTGFRCAKDAANETQKKR